MLRNYYRILFKPENCVFVLHSSKSLKEMRLYAQKYFDFKLEEPTQEYKNLYKDKEKALDNPIFLENSLGKIAFFNYTRDTPLLLISFPISQRSGNVEIDKILRYLFYKKEDNSLLQYLYDNNFISYFEIYCEGRFKNNEMITFNFDLTKDGYENVDKIIEAFFATVNALRDSDNIQDLLNNLKLIDNSTFINGLESYPIDINDIFNVLNNYMLFGPEKMLGSPNDLMYKENRIKEIINELSVENAFIFIDSKDELKSKYLTSDELLFTKNYKTPYRMNKIDDDYLNNLTTIKSVDNYTFELRTKNEKHTKLKELTKKPCYENKGDKCEYDEYNPNEDKIYMPYVIRNSDGVYSLMKIDRSFGVPFVKGYIELILDENKFKDVFNDTANIISYYLFLYSFDYKFSFSDLYEGNSTISLPQRISNKITIEFSTYNDLLEDVIKYIIDFFETPIDESTFNSMKEKLYLLSSNENGVSIGNIFNDARFLFERFMTADSLDESPYDKESFYNSSYSDYNDIFFSANNMITNLKYLTHGDISYEQSNRTTEELSILINKTLEITLKLSAQKKIEIPENTSILYFYKIPNPNQRQGGILVRYEFDRTLMSEMRMYSLCAFSFFFDYLRTKRGTGYNVRIMPVNMGVKSYLQIFAIGKVYSPEKMDRFINEAIIESFSYKKCLVDEIMNHMENKLSAQSFYAEEKFNDLKSFLNPEQLNNFKLNKENYFNYDSIIQKVKETLIDKPKRIAILLHRGDITDEEYEKQKAELDKSYFLNANITNELTEDIKYLNKYGIN